VPLTAAAHRRAAVPVVALLGAAVVAVDLARFGAGLDVLGAVNTALVWVFVHQLGYLWRDGMLAGADPGVLMSRSADPGWRAHGKDRGGEAVHMVAAGNWSDLTGGEEAGDRVEA
jgi:hypothetical protein